MANLFDLGVMKTTSDRNNALNDTGRTAFCGPYVVSAITGFPISKVEAAIVAFRRAQQTPDETVKGTTTDEVRAALTPFGYEMVLVSDYNHCPRNERPSITAWMAKPRKAWSYYVLAIHKGREGHWVVVRGVKLSDTYSGGIWQFVCNGPHKGARVMEAYEVRLAVVSTSSASPG